MVVDTEGEGVGHVELHSLAVHGDGLLLGNLHQVLGLVNRPDPNAGWDTDSPKMKTRGSGGLVPLVPPTDAAGNVTQNT